jgi:hypothetical protein
LVKAKFSQFELRISGFSQFFSDFSQFALSFLGLCTHRVYGRTLNSQRTFFAGQIESGSEPDWPSPFQKANSFFKHASGETLLEGPRHKAESKPDRANPLSGDEKLLPTG